MAQYPVAGPTLTHPHAPTIYDSVPVTDIKKSFQVAGSLVEFMKGQPGTPIDCGISNLVDAAIKLNPTTLPFPVLWPPAVTRSRILFVDKIKGGKPAHCYRAAHNYAWLVDINDKDPEKTLIKKHPEMIEQRTFTFYRPTQRDSQAGSTAPRGARTGERKYKAMTGAARRARDANRLDPAIARKIYGV